MSDPFCFEAFASLVEGHLLTGSQEQELLDAVEFPANARWLELMYRCKCKKVLTALIPASFVSGPVPLLQDVQHTWRMSIVRSLSSMPQYGQEDAAEVNLGELEQTPLKDITDSNGQTAAFPRAEDGATTARKARSLLCMTHQPAA